MRGRECEHEVNVMNSEMSRFADERNVLPRGGLIFIISRFMINTVWI